MKKLAREQRRLSRKKKGSSNRNKQRIRVAAVHEKINDQRNDFLHKQSTMLEYKAAWYSSSVVRIPTMYPSSQTCSCCGFKNPTVKDLKIRDWVCPECNTHHNRDTNAAINILSKGLSMTA